MEGEKLGWHRAAHLLIGLLGLENHAKAKKLPGGQELWVGET